MSVRSSVDIGFFLIDGLDMAGVLTALTGPTRQSNTAPAPGINAKWNAVRAVGTKRGELSQSGVFDAGVGSSHALIANYQDVKRVLCINFAENLIGRSFAGMAGGYAGKYDVKIAQNQLVLADAQYDISGEVEDGVILHELSEETAAGNTEATPVDRAADPMVKAIAITSSSVASPSVITCPEDHGLTDQDVVLIAGHAGSTPAINGEHVATVTGVRTFTIPVNVTVAGAGGTVKRAWTKNGGAGYLQVHAVTLGGYDSATIKVRHKATGGAFADLLTFTAVAATGAERKIVAAGATVNRQLATSIALIGAGSGFSIEYMVGFARG